MTTSNIINSGIVAVALLTLEPTMTAHLAGETTPRTYRVIAGSGASTAPGRAANGSGAVLSQDRFGAADPISMDRFAEKGDKEWVWPDPTGTCVSVFNNPLTMAYPFVPKSNKFLVPGHFWGYELPDGRWGAARMLGLGTPSRSRRVAFLGQNHDWVGDAPPTAADIESAPLLDERLMSCHVKNISDFTEVLGWASTDGLDYPEAFAGIDPVERDGVVYDGVTGYLGFPLELTEPTQTAHLHEEWMERYLEQSSLSDERKATHRELDRDERLSVRVLFDALAVSRGALYYGALQVAFDKTVLSPTDHAVYLTRQSRSGTTYGRVTPEQIAESSIRLDALAAGKP